MTPPAGRDNNQAVSDVDSKIAEGADTLNSAGASAGS